MRKVLLFSADSNLKSLLRSALERDYDVISSRETSIVSDMVARDSLDVLLLDVDPAVCAPAGYTHMHDTASTRGVSVVLMVDDASRQLAIDLVEAGAHSYCTKPPSLRELKLALDRASELTRMKGQLTRGKSAFRCPPEDGPRQHGLVGAGPAMRAVRLQIDRVSGLNASVLITGESGTGKELIARAIHNSGTRRNAPFVAVSCGAIPETLIESELFGHEKGAFTGSTGTHCGYFEQAGAGTLFLDEIGELTPQVQVKLLRILQQKEFCRVGSGRSVPLKARLIFATHRNLSKMVAEGTFRLDLFYRVNVVSIHAPSLAQRIEDIAVLSAHFLTAYSKIFEKEVHSISHAALELLRSYEWPGNVRELENVLQSAIIQTEDEEIQPRDLPAVIRSRAAEPEDIDVAQAGRFERLLRDYKIRLVLKAVEEHEGNKTLAARSLDISRAYLYRLLDQHEENVHVA